MSDLLDSMFDTSIDDLKDIPVFKARPAGSYLAQFTWEKKDGDKIPYLSFNFKLQELIELAGKPDESNPVPDFNQEGGVKVMINAFPVKLDKSGNMERNAFGEGIIKLICQGLKDAFPGANTKEILEQSNGAIVAATFKVTKRKDKDTGEVREQNELVSVIAAN